MSNSDNNSENKIKTTLYDSANELTINNNNNDSTSSSLKQKPSNSITSLLRDVASPSPSTSSGGSLKKSELGNLALNLIDRFDKYRREKNAEKTNLNDKTTTNEKSTASGQNSLTTTTTTTTASSPVSNAANSLISSLAISFHKNVNI